jgi:hypothetical protein
LIIYGNRPIFAAGIERPWPVAGNNEIIFPGRNS